MALLEFGLQVEKLVTDFVQLLQLSFSPILEISVQEALLKNINHFLAIIDKPLEWVLLQFSGMAQIVDDLIDKHVVVSRLRLA